MENEDEVFENEVMEEESVPFLATNAGVMALAILTIAVIVVISVAVVAGSSSTVRRGTFIGADEIAEAGMFHAAGILATLNESDGDDVLFAGDGIPGTGDELAFATAELGPIPMEGVRFGGGVYRVSVSDDAGDDDAEPGDTNGVVLVKVLAISADKEEAVHEAEVRIGVDYPAILTNGPLRLSGDLEFLGDFGYPHTSGFLLLGDEICTESAVEDADQLWQTDSLPNCMVMRALGAKKAPAPIPAVDVSKEFRPLAHYILGASGGREGMVTDGEGRLIHRAGTARSRGSWSNRESRWEWEPGTSTWRHSGREIEPGAYHSDGNLEIVGPLGSQASPARVTLSADGFISFDGAIHMRPYNEPYIAVAGTDLLIMGSPVFREGYSYQGLLRANDQIGVKGWLRLSGSLISANHSDDDSAGCSCNPVQLVDGVQELSVNGSILNEGRFVQPRIRNHQKKKKRPAD
jgi:hypothetical protein